MTWKYYYDKFFDWSESTQINKLSSVDALGAPDEVTEVMLELTFNHEDIANRIARKAIDQKLVFSAENISDLTNCIDIKLQEQLALQSASAFSKEDLENLEGTLDDDVIVELYKKKGLKVPDVFIDDIPIESDRETIAPKRPGRFFSNMAMVFAIGHGISKGIEDATGKSKNNRDDL